MEPRSLSEPSSLRVPLLLLSSPAPSTTDHPKILEAFKGMDGLTPIYFEGLKGGITPAEASLLEKVSQSAAPSPHFYDFLTTLRLDYSSEIAIVIIPDGSDDVIGVGRLVIVRLDPNSTLGKD